MCRFLSLVLFVLVAAPLAAQPPGAAVRGIVRDGSGALAGGAKASVTQRETNLVRSVETADDGQYVVSALPPGPYRLEVTRPGFKSHIEEFELFVSQDLRLDVALQVGAPSEQVVVTAASIALERDSTAVGAIVENAQVVALPLDGRNFLELSLLAPGTVPAPQGSASSVRGDFAFSASGAREDANAFLLDGVDNVDPKLNTPAVRPAVDAIREFEVLTSSYEAESGRYSGAQVNVVLKSGANTVRGTGWEFFRNGALDARNFFAPAGEPDPDYRRHQFGGSIGGPILPGPPVLLRRLRGHAQRRRHHARHERADGGRTRGRFLAAACLRRRSTPFTGQPFPGNRIPAFLRRARSAARSPRCTRCPTATCRFQNFVSSPNQDDAVDQFDVRGSIAGWSVGVSARYSFSDRRLFEPFTGPRFRACPVRHQISRGAARTSRSASRTS